MALQSVRGTHDLLPELQARHTAVTHAARTVAERFGFQEMSTPIFEFSEVFKRTLGEASDIVNKEMYTFQDRNGEELTLRPEGTAGIARAFISEGLSQRTPLKIFYNGPMFRYERPQKGRQRQFHQFGVELLGTASPYADVETIALGHEILKALKIDGLAALELNSIGDEKSRAAYVEALTAYLRRHESALSADSQRRLGQNPLRILDSKDEKDHALLKNAPLISEYYTPEAKAFLDRVTEGLGALGIPFKLNPFLVRGLDYYTHCVFEYKTTALGAQDAILSGGRYDQLVKWMGGPETPSVGWAAGVERLVMLTAAALPASRPVAVIPVMDTVEREAHALAHRLRQAGLHCEIAFSGNLSKRMKRAANQNSWAAIVLGPEELAKGQVGVKLMDSGEQKVLPLAGIETALGSLKP